MTSSSADILSQLQALAAGAATPKDARKPDEATAPPGTEEDRASRGEAEHPHARTLRVDVETLDRLLDLAGEMAVGRGRLKAALEQMPAGAALAAAEIHSEADRLHADLQELVMKARMEPLGPTFRRFARSVRDLGAALGKSARLLIEGEDVEVDTKVIEHIRDPLTHLVRNALSHGLEAPDERVARGKDARGLVRLRAFRETGGIVIEVEDDGLGLSRERITRRAREMGVLPEGEALSEAALLDLIFEPGFSTASAVTEVSGRGVGLDVVRRNVEALRGSVRVASREGQGTTFTIRLPLSLSIIPGFAVLAGAETFILPLEAVVECLELPPGGLHGHEGTGLISLRGEPLSCRRLRSRFELEGEPPAARVRGGGAARWPAARPGRGLPHRREPDRAEAAGPPLPRAGRDRRLRHPGERARWRSWSTCRASFGRRRDARPHRPGVRGLPAPHPSRGGNLVSPPPRRRSVSGRLGRSAPRARPRAPSAPTSATSRRSTPTSRCACSTASPPTRPASSASLVSSSSSNAKCFPPGVPPPLAGQRPRRIRVWSAGCSTGEEPYSLAMSLLAHCPARRSAGEIEIVATDLSTRVLDRARAAVWPVEDAREIPSAYLQTLHAARGPGPGREHEGRARDPRRGPLPAAEPQPRPLPAFGPLRPDLLPQRPHLLRAGGQGEGPRPAPGASRPRRATCSSATPRA